MPTKREREYYRMGFMDGQRGHVWEGEEEPFYGTVPRNGRISQVSPRRTTGKKRKLSAWNKFVKANAKKPRFRLRSDAPNLKKLGVAFRKTPAGKKKRR